MTALPSAVAGVAGQVEALLNWTPAEPVFQAAPPSPLTTEVPAASAKPAPVRERVPVAVLRPAALARPWPVAGDSVDLAVAACADWLVATAPTNAAPARPTAMPRRSAFDAAADVRMLMRCVSPP